VVPSVDAVAGREISRPCQESNLCYPAVSLVTILSYADHEASNTSVHNVTKVILYEWELSDILAEYFKV
jgi:uncharacterized surface protein with fasciclin (FAS1) repeats